MSNVLATYLKGVENKEGLNHNLFTATIGCSAPTAAQVMGQYVVPVDCMLVHVSASVGYLGTGAGGTVFDVYIQPLNVAIVPFDFTVAGAIYSKSLDLTTTGSTPPYHLTAGDRVTVRCSAVPGTLNSANISVNLTLLTL